MVLGGNENQKNMGYCKEHGKFDSDTCHGCIDARRQEADDRAEANERLVEANERLERLLDSTPSAADIAHKINNPGDYQCPRCLLYTLKLNALTCPICHKDVPVDYWPPIREEVARQKKANEKAAKIEAEARAKRDRIQAEADAEAREQAAQVAAREAEERRLIRKRVLFGKIYFGYLVPILTVVSLLVWARFTTGPSLTVGADICLYLVPGLNWLIVLAGSLSTDAMVMEIRGILAFWLAVGVIIYGVILVADLR